MAYNGSGTFNREYNWVTDRNDGLTIQASRMDGEMDSIATALSLCLLKDGQQTPTANIPWGGFKLTNLGDATNATDALNRQAADARYPLKIVSVDNAISRFDGIAGQQQTSILLIDDTGNISPATHDTGALGTTALRFADLFLASGAVVTWGGASTNDVTLTHSADVLAFAGAASGYSFDNFIALENDGLRIKDTDASHKLTIKGGSNLTADRIFTLTTGDAARTLDISAASVTVSAYGATLVDDADAATARATLGLIAVTTDNAVSRYDSTAGATQNSGVIIDDSNNITGAASFASSSAALTAQLSAQSTDATSGVWPAAVLYRNSATPAASDNLASLIFRGRDSGATDADYARVKALILDPTDGSEDGQLVLGALVGGVNTDIVTVGPGVQIGTPSGGDKGAGTLNATTLYEGGTALSAKYATFASDVGTYVTGTFTPTVTLVGGAGNTVPVYSTNTGRYTRIGNRVFVDIYLTGDGGAEGAGTGNINVALPIASSASFPAEMFSVGVATHSTFEFMLYGGIVAAASTIALFTFETDTITRRGLTGADQGNATRSIRLQFHYEV